MKSVRLASLSLDALSLQESSEPQDIDRENDDHDDFDLEHDQYLMSQGIQPATSADQQYVVDVSPAKYAQKLNAAILKHDMAKANKNGRKHDLLFNNDLDGIRELIEKYRQEKFQLRLENNHLRYKCAETGVKATNWGHLASALRQVHQELPTLSQLIRSEKEGLSEKEEAEYQRRKKINQAAQSEADLIIAHVSSPDIFNIDRSQEKLDQLRTGRDSRDHPVDPSRLLKAIKKHDHRVNALINRKAEDAFALASIYDLDFDKHRESLKELTVKEDRVNIRRIAWERKWRQVLNRARFNGHQH